MGDTISHLAVGQPYPGGPIPPDTMGFHPDGGLLVAGMASPTPEDIAAFKSTDGWVEFALVPLGRLLITLIRWPDSPTWNDSPWTHVGGERGNWFEVDQLGDNPKMRYTVAAVLVDTDTQLVAALRFFTLSPHYSQAWQRELQRRLDESPVTEQEFYAMAAEYQARYPDPKKLLERAVARCKAGLP